MHPNPYRRFFLMLAVSFVVMYVVMYLNTYELGDVYPSLMRFYMTVLMVAPMALIMLLFMRHMYTNQRQNLLIAAGCLGVFAGTFALMRTQTFVNDRRWVQAMIPHHSIAILTSERASLQDPEVRRLAHDIIQAQRREIAQMKQMLKRLK
ncbi:DUF305 domain-containing protein [Hymenobacter pini]|uniref:DUF305 domain-containing protein n=1 Tax=Hymenobacter pini TaxID=2880879 RepID=UPI001CF39018|nr:DUF305 domain-containing protein [Hymenobacter pini]MCA8830088.1 DUF305 domain-containing protein [Hymenobacter pini]